MGFHPRPHTHLWGSTPDPTPTYGAVPPFPPQPYFGKLMKRKWLTNSDAFDAIVLHITTFSQKLRPLRPEPYQVGTPLTPYGGLGWVPWPHSPLMG